MVGDLFIRVKTCVMMGQKMGEDDRLQVKSIISEGAVERLRMGFLELSKGISG